MTMTDDIYGDGGARAEFHRTYLPNNGCHENMKPDKDDDSIENVQARIDLYKRTRQVRRGDPNRRSSWS